MVAVFQALYVSVGTSATHRHV